MLEYVVRVLITALVVVAVTEIAKRSPLWAAVLASLPLTSVLAFVWLYIDSEPVGQIAALSRSIFWLVLPSLVLFLVLPLLLVRGLSFWISLFASCAATAITYFLTIRLLGQFGVKP